MIYAINMNGRQSYRGNNQADLSPGKWVIINPENGTEKLVSVKADGSRELRGYHSITPWGARAARDNTLAADTCYLANVKF
jgi:hypothetical protein